MTTLEALDLPEARQGHGRGAGQDCRAGPAEEAPDLTLTVDPGEYRGFEYQTGVSFTMFARGVRGELGRGGRYEAGVGRTSSEPATGFSLYVDSLLPALPKPKPQDKLYLAASARREREAKRLRGDGHAHDPGLERFRTTTRRKPNALGCSHYWDGRAVKPVG